MRCSIETTYTMRREVIELLQKATLKTGKKWEILIAHCIRRMMSEQKKYWRDLQQIEYQKRKDIITNTPIPKFRVKFKFYIREYNYFQDIRKFFSMSISLAIATAVFTYLEQVVIDLIRDGYEEDTYPYQNYIFIVKCIENIITFSIWWEIPPDLSLLFK
ncbi:MAG: hypothetical protein N2316_05615 [Spirochaetes bacterium]|nr:hypothetical protein [Spirochaetota bacterium]